MCWLCACVRVCVPGGVGGVAIVCVCVYVRVESKTYDETGVRTLLPLPQCAHDHSDKALSDNLCVLGGCMSKCAGD